MSYYKNLTAARKFQGGGIAVIGPAEKSVKITPKVINITPTLPKNSAWDAAQASYREEQALKNPLSSQRIVERDREAYVRNIVATELAKTKAREKTKADAAAAKTKADAVAEAAAKTTAVGTPVKTAGTKTTARTAIKPTTATSSGKGSFERAKIIRIQRALGFSGKDLDGIWGPKTQAASDAIKATQESLGFTGKDVDGIQGPKTRAAINTRLNDAEAQVLALKAPSTFDKAQEPIRFIQPTKTDREVKREARQIRRDERHDRRDLRRSIRDEELDFAFRSGGIFYNCKK